MEENKQPEHRKTNSNSKFDPSDELKPLPGDKARIVRSREERIGIGRRGWYPTPSFVPPVPTQTWGRSHLGCAYFMVVSFFAICLVETSIGYPLGGKESSQWKSDTEPMICYIARTNLHIDYINIGCQPNKFHNLQELACFRPRVETRTPQMDYGECPDHRIWWSSSARMYSLILYGEKIGFIKKNHPPSVGSGSDRSKESDIGSFRIAVIYRRCHIFNRHFNQQCLHHRPYLIKIFISNSIIVNFRHLVYTLRCQ